MKNKRLSDMPLVEPAGSEEALGTIRELWAFRHDKTLVKENLDRRPLGQLQSIARRIMMDIMKGPSQEAPGPEVVAARSATAQNTRAAPGRAGAKRSERGRRSARRS